MEPLRFPAAFLSQLGPFISSTILLCCGTRYIVLTAPRTNAGLPSLDCALLKASLILVYWWNRNKPTPCQCASVPAGRLHLSSHAQPPPKYTATPTACSTVFCSASSPPTAHARAQLGLPSHGSLCSTPATLTLAPTSTNVVLVQAVPPSWTSRQCIASVTIARRMHFSSHPVCWDR